LKVIAVALVNPLRTHRFAGEELARTKTDNLDRLQIERFGAQKSPARPACRRWRPRNCVNWVRLRTRLIQATVARVNQLHRLIDLGFPEFTRYLSDLNTELANALLRQYPTVQAFRALSPRRLAKLRYEGRHQVGKMLTHYHRHR
jgi:transposase